MTTSTRRRGGGTMLATALLLLAPLALRAEDLAITFDDLPLNGALPQGATHVGIVADVLAILKRSGVPQVYGFVNAGRYDDSADGTEALRRWVAGGQRVGNHTFAHGDLNDETVDVFMRDVRVNEPMLAMLDPGNHWHWLRYPYLHEGATRAKRRAVRAQLSQRGYRIAQTTLDYEDYLWNNPYARCVAQGDAQAIAWLRSSYLAIATQYLQADRQMAQILYGRAISHVLLLHLGAFSSTILPDLLELLRAQGFALVTLEAAQRDVVYSTDPDVGARTGGSLLEQWLDARGLQYPPVPPKPYKELETLCR